MFMLDILLPLSLAVLAGLLLFRGEAGRGTAPLVAACVADLLLFLTFALCGEEDADAWIAAGAVALTAVASNAILFFGSKKRGVPPVFYAASTTLVAACAVYAAVEHAEIRTPNLLLDYAPFFVAAGLLLVASVAAAKPVAIAGAVLAMVCIALPSANTLVSCVRDMAGGIGADGYAYDLAKVVANSGWAVHTRISSLASLTEYDSLGLLPNLGMPTVVALVAVWVAAIIASFSRKPASLLRVAAALAIAIALFAAARVACGLLKHSWDRQALEEYAATFIDEGIESLPSHLKQYATGDPEISSALESAADDAGALLRLYLRYPEALVEEDFVFQFPDNVVDLDELARATISLESINVTPTSSAGDDQ